MTASQLKEKIFTQVNLLRFTCFFWILGKIFTYESWLGGRDLPTVSFIEALDSLPSQIHLILYILSITLLTVVLIKPRRWLIVVFMFFEVFSVLLDALRLHAWEYMYLFLFGYLALYFNKPVYFRRVLICILASTYFFSGIHKFNGAFLHYIWDLFFIRKIFSYDSQITPFIHYAGLLMSMIEAAAGFLLLFSKTRKMAIFILVAMHLFILFFKIVIEHQPFNSIVPWNIMTIIYLVYLFNKPLGVQTVNKENYFPATARMVLGTFWFVLPLCSFVNFWPLELSSGMFTGKNNKVYICVKDSESMKAFRKVYIHNVKNTICEEGNIFNLSVYTHFQSTQEPFNAVWYYKRLCYRLREKYPDNDIRIFYSAYRKKKIVEIK